LSRKRTSDGISCDQIIINNDNTGNLESIHLKKRRRVAEPVECMNHVNSNVNTVESHLNTSDNDKTKGSTVQAISSNTTGGVQVITDDTNTTDGVRTCPDNSELQLRIIKSNCTDRYLRSLGTKLDCFYTRIYESMIVDEDFDLVWLRQVTAEQLKIYVADKPDKATIWLINLVDKLVYEQKMDNVADINYASLVYKLIVAGADVNAGNGLVIARLIQLVYESSQMTLASPLGVYSKETTFNKQLAHSKVLQILPYLARYYTQPLLITQDTWKKITCLRISMAKEIITLLDMGKHPEVILDALAHVTAISAAYGLTELELWLWEIVMDRNISPESSLMESIVDTMVNIISAPGRTLDNSNLIAPSIQFGLSHCFHHCPLRWKALVMAHELSTRMSTLSDEKIKQVAQWMPNESRQECEKAFKIYTTLCCYILQDWMQESPLVLHAM